MIVEAESQIEIDAQIAAAATLYNINQWAFDHAAWKIVGKNWPGATKKLADLCGAAEDWVEGRAHTYQLKRELVMWRCEAALEGRELEDAFRNHFRNITEIPESHFRAVALKFAAKDELIKLSLPESLEYLEMFAGPMENGEAYTIQEVRAALPHQSRAVDYGGLIKKVAKWLHHFEIPVKLDMNEKQQKIAGEIAATAKKMRLLFEEFQEET